MRAGYVWGCFFYAGFRPATEFLFATTLAGEAVFEACREFLRFLLMQEKLKLYEFRFAKLGSKAKPCYKMRVSRANKKSEASRQACDWGRCGGVPRRGGSGQGNKAEKMTLQEAAFVERLALGARGRLPPSKKIFAHFLATKFHFLKKHLLKIVLIFCIIFLDEVFSNFLFWRM